MSRIGPDGKREADEDDYFDGDPMHWTHWPLVVFEPGLASWNPERCESGCGRLIFSCADFEDRRRKWAEVERIDGIALWPEHTPARCRAWRSLVTA